MNDVTIIIPCGGHHGQFVGEAVDSAIAAGADNIIVVDDKSCPPVDLKRFKSVIVSCPVDHIGRSAARNIAISLAMTKWLYFLDADDWMEPTAISDFRTILDQCDSEPQMIYADYHYRTEGDPDHLILVKKAEFMRKRWDTRNLVNIGMFVKCDRFKLIGGFDEDVSMGEYWDFFLKYTANPKITVYKHSRPFFIARANGSVHPDPKRALMVGSRKIACLIKAGYYLPWRDI